MSQSWVKSVRLLSNILITALFLTGCGQNTHYAPVTDSHQPPSEKLTHHLVAKGETLYSIAWRYNMDYRKLAASNGIPSDFKIYPGQRLNLTESVTPSAPAIPQRTKLTKVSPKPSVTQKPRSKKETPLVAKPPTSSTKRNPRNWVWPAKGKLISGFQSNRGLNKGIDIRGNLRDSVIAAAAGRVVYSGEGLRGYGKLVIVKHSDKYLSAYAHNHRILVDEGADVTQGQKIAEMGSTGTDSVKLHFEIRYDGKPINPLKYLPKR